MPHSGDHRLDGHGADATGHAHVCWSYDGHAEFQRGAAEFLDEGLALGRRVLLVGPGSPESLAAALSGVEGAAAALATGAAEVCSIDDTYGGGGVVDPPAQVDAYAAATERALADGYTGLRVAAQATPLVRTPEQLAAFLRYEHLVDRYAAGHPFSALCAYDTSVLGEDAVAWLAGVHPRTNRPGPFRLHATAEPGVSARLAGELDLNGQDRFKALLAHVDLRPEGGEIVLHAPELTFIDHQGLLALAAYARQRGTTAVLRTGWLGAARVVDALDLADVRVEPLG
ncbi:MEDS domain-containing protein [Saccharothrix algeriensis]|uniref:MEDS domain-containing protein n=1 Tax=Saccharothrix algeriensis TaxID=173560 RepID=A0A8T8I0N0_9PSEU|nr:MEDS domain-containing protein [Saccharothrix algeriensis]MBM7809975.1 hypothetical protein [Saccharothrix algeriensis]QTR04218.1 MEDS domain-containing protein [Saccharothrix algeriensis]